MCSLAPLHQSIFHVKVLHQKITIVTSSHSSLKMSKMGRDNKTLLQNLEVGAQGLSKDRDALTTMLAARKASLAKVKTCLLETAKSMKCVMTVVSAASELVSIMSAIAD